MDGPHAADRSIPRVVGERLGVVVGSSLTRHPLPGGGDHELIVEGALGAPVAVTVIDHGHVVSLRRHGADGRTPAHLVDHHAHVRALVAAGCDRVLALGSSGSLRGDWPVGTLVLCDDLFALGTYPTFHDTVDGYGLRGFDPSWRAEVAGAWPTAGRPLEPRGTYAQVTGPRFETPAEVRFLASAADLVGMTLAAECVLAAEAGLRYAAICQVDNLANGLGEDGASPVDAYLDHTRVLTETFVHEIVALVDALVAASPDTTVPVAASQSPTARSEERTS